jgi:serine/threonine-protein kinase
MELHAGASVCTNCGTALTAPTIATTPRATGIGSVVRASGELPSLETQPAVDDPVLAQVQRSVATFYKVERLLGRGRTTVVYQAAGLNPPRPVALKLLPRGLGVGPAATRFTDEARKAQALSHPNIVPIYTIGLRGGAPYFVATKFLEGRSLEAVIQSQGALPLPSVLVVLRATAEALNYAHGRGTIHGHLHAANILLDRYGRPVVTDFGIAQALEDAVPLAAGKPRFLSPEHAGGGAVGPASDQYSLGIVAHQMLTGTLSAESDSLTSMRDVSAGRGALPGGLVQVVQTVLALDPARRYASTADMLAAIQAIPFSEADRREGYAALGQLARGEPVPKVRAPARSPRDSTPATRTVAPKTVITPAVTVRVPRPTPVAPADEAVAAELFDKVPAAPPIPRVSAEVEAPAAPRFSAATPASAAKPLSATRVEEAVQAEPPVRAAPPVRATPTVNFVFGAPAEPRPERRSRMVWVLAGLLVIAGLAFAAYWVLGRGPASPTARAPAPAPRPPAPGPSVPPAPAAADSGGAGAARRVAAADSTGRSTATATETTGLLLLSTVPAAAVVLVDGRESGSDGFVDSEVTAGRRHLLVSAPGYETLDTFIRVGAGGTVNLGRIALRESATEGAARPAQGTGRLRLRAIPPTAEIFLDGRPVGVGSLVDFEVASGPRQLRISAAGYQTLDTLITVDPGATIRLGQISLKSVPAGP